MATGGPLGWGGVDLCVCRSWLTGLPKPLPLPWICFSPPLPAASFLTGVVRSGRGVEVGCQLGGRGGGAELEAAGMSHWPAGKGLAPGLREPKGRRTRQHCRPPPRSRGPTFEEKMGWGHLRQGPLPF